MVPPGPTLKEDGLNGRAVLAFDGNACLALESYTNRVAPRTINIYLVARRTAWATTPEAATEGGFGKWSGPFALARVTADKSDEVLSGAFHVSEDAAKTGRIDLGNTGIDIATPPTGEPYLFVLHSLTNGYLAAYETNATDVARVPRWAKGQDYHAEPCDIDLVHLGSRIREGGRPQWYGKGNSGNRCWFGDIGEFIVTTQPLTDDEEADLFAYLRACDGGRHAPRTRGGAPCAGRAGDGGHGGLDAHVVRRERGRLPALHRGGRRRARHDPLHAPAAPEGRGQGAGLDGRPARRAGVAHGRRGGRNNQPARKSPVAHPRRHDPDPALAAPYRSDV